MDRRSRSFSRPAGVRRTAAALARVLQRSGKRTAIVECDLRRPRLHGLQAANAELWAGATVLDLTAGAEGRRSAQRLVGAGLLAASWKGVGLVFERVISSPVSLGAFGFLVLFRHQASLGGLGILALLAQKKKGWRAGHVQMAMDAAIVCAALATVPLDRVALSVAAAVVLNLVIATNHRPGRYVAQ